MRQRWITALVVLVAVLGGVYQFHLRPLLVILGLGRIVESKGNSNCQTFPQLEACEKIILHQPTGVIYLACSTLSSREHWTPSMGRLNATGMSTMDYVATFDPSNSRIERLKIIGYDPSLLSLHGMDVVQSSDDPSQLFVYLVNHRAPSVPSKAHLLGANSSIEIFKARVGTSTLTHLKTIDDPIISTPNDVLGSDTGDSFYFTNDHGIRKTGILRDLFMDAWFKLGWGNLGYCHVRSGCRIAAEGLHDPNGIALNASDEIFVSSSKFGELYVLDKQDGGNLNLRETIFLDRPMDNLSVDKDGHVWAAGFPNALHFGLVHWKNVSIPSPASGVRISRTQPQGVSSKGGNYQVEKMFEDDGILASGSTSVVYDSERNWLFLSSVTSPHLTVCRL